MQLNPPGCSQGSSEAAQERNKEERPSGMGEWAWRLAEKKQEEHRALTPADLSSQPEGCELRVRLVSQPHPRLVRRGQVLGGRGFLDTLALDYSHDLRASPPKEVMECEAWLP